MGLPFVIAVWPVVVIGNDNKNKNTAELHQPYSLCQLFYFKGRIMII